MSARSGPGRRVPSWAKPLAPLADWLKSVDALLDEPSESFTHRAYPRYRRRSPRRQFSNHRRLRPDWLAKWRKRLDLSPTKASYLLGYAGREQILEIERGLPVKRNPKRQMQLVQARIPAAARDRSAWLRRWRKRMGLTTCQATEILDYHDRFNLWRAEHGSGPSWEKILVALAEEKHAARCASETPS